MHYVYVIFSGKLGKFYTGSTANIERRIKEHNSKVVPFTAKGVPWELVYYQAFVEKEDALREEKFLKTGKGRERRNLALQKFIETRLGK